MKSYILLLIFVLIAAACGFYLLKMQTDIVNEQADLSTSANFVQATEDGFIVRQIALSAQKSVFIPTVIRAKNGEKVKLKMINADATYRFYLPDFNIDETLTPGEEKTIEFVADKSGEFEFASDEKMKGKLVVE